MTSIEPPKMAQSKARDPSFIWTEGSTPAPPSLTGSRRYLKANQIKSMNIVSRPKYIEPGNNSDQIGVNYVPIPAE